MSDLHKTTKEVLIDGAGQYRLEQVTQGWAGSGFEYQIGELQVRRVSIQGQEEIQITVDSVEVKKSKRGYRRMQSFTLTPEQANNLVTALTKTWNHKTGRQP